MTWETYFFLVYLVYGIVLMSPAYASNGGGLLFGKGAPLDFGKNFVDGKRLIGDGATWRGLFGGVFLAIVIGVCESLIIFNPGVYGLIPPHLLNFVNSAVSANLLYSALFGFLIGLGALIGDAVGSFIKRRIGIERGRPAPILDQVDFVIGALLFASILAPVPWEVWVVCLVLSIGLHLLTNSIAYSVGLKDVWY